MKLFRKLHKHSIFVLVVTSFVALILVFRFQGMSKIQFSILTYLIAFYLSWAIIFHYTDKSLKFEIMIEYILTAVLALVILYGVLL